MTITARSALLKSAQFYTHNWRDVLLLAAKTFMIILIVNFALAGLVDLIFGTEVIPVMKELYNADWFSSSDRPPLSPTFCLANTIHHLTYACFIPPLIISISRSIILGGTFTRHFFKRLREKRTLKLALLILIMGSLSIPQYVFPYESSAGENTWLQLAQLIVPLLSIPALYIQCRLFYLEPVLSVDRQFSTIPQIWQATRGKAWLMFKTLFLLGIGLLAIGLGLSVLNHFFGRSLVLAGQGLTVNILSTPLFMLVLDPLFIGTVAYVYNAVEKEDSAS